MLKLAPAAGRELAAHGRDMVGTGLDRSIGAQIIARGSEWRMAAIRCDAFPARSNPDNQVGIVHSVAGKR